MKQAATLFLVLMFVITAVAQPGSLAQFRGGIGVIPRGNGSPNVVRNIQPPGQIWVIRDIAAEVNGDGRINVDGRGLLLGGGNGIGGNANQSVFATLLCNNDANIEHSTTLTGVALDANGDFRIHDQLVPAPPDTCDAPVLLIRSAAGKTWFAAGIPRVNSK